MAMQKLCRPPDGRSIKFAASREGIHAFMKRQREAQVFSSHFLQLFLRSLSIFELFFDEGRRDAYVSIFSARNDRGCAQLLRAVKFRRGACLIL